MIIGTRWTPGERPADLSCVRTEVIRVGAESRTEIARAADLLRNGEIVAFPTETVYGLGADARLDAAVRKIFTAKGRPSTRPLILHVDGPASAARLVERWDDTAALLARTYWPGPLTLVLPKATGVLDAITAGGPTVAVRAPRHPVSRALIEALGAPIAAPSANRSDKLSPTLAAHVLADLDGLIPLILDGGPTEVGLESTILDLSVSGAAPRVLRQGAIPAGEIARLLGVELTGGEALRPVSAGVPIRLFTGAPPSDAPLGRSLVLLRSDSRWRAVDRSGAPPLTNVSAPSGRTPASTSTSDVAPQLEILPADPEGYAHKLYDALRRAESLDVDTVWVEAPPDPSEDDRWAAIRARLLSAET